MKEHTLSLATRNAVTTK